MRRRAELLTKVARPSRLSVHMEQGLGGSLGLDSVIQGALAAGVPIPQVLQFLQSSQQQQHQPVAQTAATPAAHAQQQQHNNTQQFLAAVAAATSGPLFGAQNAVSGLSSAHNNLFGLHPSTQPTVNVSQALVSQAQQASLQANNVGLGGHAQTQTAAAGATGAAAADQRGLHWPICQPSVQVPHFDMSTYQKVDLDVQPSQVPSGLDLPLHDMNTLRFFFNFGVHHARQILLREHLQAPQSGANAGGAAGQTQIPTQTSVASQLAASQAAASNPFALLTGNDLLFQQALLKSGTDVLSGSVAGAGKPIGTPLPGSTSAVTDPRSAFQLQRDLASSLGASALQNSLAQLSKQQQQQQQQQNSVQVKSEPLDSFLLHNTLLQQSAQLRTNTSQALASTPLAILQQQQQQQHQHHQQQQQNAQNQESQNEILRPHAISATQVQQQLMQQQQQQLLGGIGLALQGNKVLPTSLSAQVPVDPAPRTLPAATAAPTSAAQEASSSPATGKDANASSSAYNKFGQTQRETGSAESNDRMKPTAIVRGAVADAAMRNRSPASGNATAKPSGESPPNRSPPNAQPNPQATNFANALVQNLGSDQVSLAAQLSAAMVASTFLNQAKSTNASSAAQPVNPDAHLLAGTSPFAKFPALTQSARSLTSGQSGLAQTATSSAGGEHDISGGIELKPESILQTSEQHFTEAFKRAQQHRGGAAPASASEQKSDAAAAAAASAAAEKDKVHRKTGLNMISSTEEEAKKKVSAEKPNPAMINYVNTCLTTLKNQVQSHGAGLPIDHNGRPIDYSTRPIDPIFRQAREKLEKDRDFNYLRRNSPGQPGADAATTSSTTPTAASADASTSSTNCPIGISDRCRSEQPADVAQKVAALSPPADKRPRSTQPIVDEAKRPNGPNGTSTEAPPGKRARVDGKAD